VDTLSRKAAEKKDSSDSPNPMDSLSLDKVAGAIGLKGLKTVAFNLQPSSEGSLFQLFFGVPESGRQGIFKLLVGEPKETTPPPFVPADAVKFQRWRLDGQKAWAALEKMLTDFNPAAIGALNFVIDTANANAKEKDPDFDIRKNLIGNLGDDMITYEKVPRGTATTDLQSPPSLFLLGSPDPDQLTASLKSILVFLSQQAGSPTEREFLGRKIYSVPLPSMPLPGALPSSSAKPKTLHYASSGGYVAFSTDPSIVEEYLRSTDSHQKPLRETAGLSEAAQKVTGPGTGLFGYENQADSMRFVFDSLRKSGSSTNADSNPLNTLAAMGVNVPGQNMKDWLDFSLLPSFDKVVKYFSFSVYGGSANVEGLSFKLFAPVPAQLRGAPSTAAAK
jgi:hypothetical protein